MKSFAQLGQDLFALKRFANVKNPFFLDIGAYDGVRMSNTFLLEQNGWRGICVEANPTVFPTLQQTRRKSRCIKAACFSKSNEKLPFVEASILSGFDDYLNYRKERLHDNPRLTVNTTTVTQILDRLKAPQIIHYMSLDTEGSEYEIMKGIDFDKYKFPLITVEHNNVYGLRMNIRALMGSHGYKFIQNNEWDDYYAYSGGF
jgi:FkbM family methyltransferase